MKSLGQKHLTMVKIDAWLSKNIDKFYADDALRTKILNMKVDISDLDALMNIKNSDYQKSRMKLILANYGE